MTLLKKIYYLCSRDLILSVLYLFVIMVFSSIIELVSLAATIPIIQSILKNYEENKFVIFLLSYDFVNTTNLFLYLFLIFIITFCFKFIINIYFIYLKSKFITNIRSYLSKKFFSLYLEKDFYFFIRAKSSELIRNCDQEITVFSRCINAIITLKLEILILILTLVLILRVQPIQTLIPFVLLGLISLIYFKVVKKYLEKIGLIRFDLQAKKIQYLQQGFGSYREIKINQKTSFFSNIFDKTITKIMKIIRIRMIMGEIIRPSYEFFIILAVLANIFILRALDYSLEATIAIILFYAVISLRLLPAFNKILVNLQTLNFNSPSISKLYDELKFGLRHKSDEKIYDEIRFNKKIEIVNLDFKYPNNDNLIFKNLNLEIFKSDIIGIMGPSGSGKSTFLDFLTGLLYVKNSIKVDNIFINFPNTSWTNKFSYSSEKSYCFDDTFIKNITFEEKIENIDQGKLNECLEIVELKNKKGENEIDLNSPVGERGQKLSAGQRQRLSLARALYKKSEIIIIDEGTNSVDEKMQDNIIFNIIQFCKKKNITLVLVSHDSKVIKFCEKKYILKNKSLEKY